MFHVLKHSARAHREVRPTNHENIAKSLRTLAAFTRFISQSGIEWYLTGGIAVDLIKRNSFREHGDLDVVMPIEEAPKLRSFLREAGVGAYRRISTARFRADDRITVFRRANPDIGDFGKHRTLKLFMGPSERLLPVVDIHFVSQTGLGSSILCDRKIVHLPFPLKGGNKFTVNGERIECCDLRLMLYMKSDNNPRNFLDAQRIAHELPQLEQDHVTHLRAISDKGFKRGERPLLLFRRSNAELLPLPLNR